MKCKLQPPFKQFLRIAGLAILYVLIMVGCIFLTINYTLLFVTGVFILLVLFALAGLYFSIIESTSWQLDEFEFKASDWQVIKHWFKTNIINCD